MPRKTLAKEGLSSPPFAAFPKKCRRQPLLRQGWRRFKKRNRMSCLVAAVVVDQAAVGDGLALSLGKEAGGDLELGNGFIGLYRIGIEQSIIG